MARISGVDIPREKRVDISLRYIYGIGATTARRIVSQAQVNPATKVRDLTDEEVNRIRELIDKGQTVEGDLRREVRQNIQRLIEVFVQLIAASRELLARLQPLGKPPSAPSDNGGGEPRA